MRLTTFAEPIHPPSDRVLGRITRTPCDPPRSDYIWLTDDFPALDEARGYAAVIAIGSLSSSPWAALGPPLFHQLEHSGVLQEGDVAAINPNGRIFNLYRRESRSNTLLATERCNSFCIMCSQPPRSVDDSHLIKENLKIISLIDPATRELGVSGGEPTLLKGDFLRVVAACRDHLPNTSLHVLTNGRLFSYFSFAEELARIEHPDLMLGIPIYSDVHWEHDFVVQARGAFDQTLLGLQNLARCGVSVEIRVVIHRTTVSKLLRIAEFIYRNATFSAHIALMGLEPIGLAVLNLDSLWIDPWDYRRELAKAARFLVDRGMNVSVYNHQLCTVDESIRNLCRQSISDWKNDFLPVCSSCSQRTNCAGFFSSNLRRRYSTHITPL